MRLVVLSVTMKVAKGIRLIGSFCADQTNRRGIEKVISDAIEYRLVPYAVLTPFVPERCSECDRVMCLAPQY